MSNFTAVYDACVLYPALLRDLLMHLALSDQFRAKWTDAIHDEWIRNLLHDRPDLTLAQLQRTRELMNQHVRDCLVTNYEDLIPALTLPDPDDRHVVAAAIRGRVARALGVCHWQRIRRAQRLNHREASSNSQPVLNCGTVNHSR